MFIATLIVCSFFDGQSAPSTCIQLEDTNGVLKTQEACYERTNEMVNELLDNSLLNYQLFMLLGNPDNLYIKQTCVSAGVQV